MRWTTKLPSKPGYYWVKINKMPFIIEIYESTEDSIQELFVDDNGVFISLNNYAQDNMKFFGPLNPPNESQNRKIFEKRF